ncbi:MAG: hypothetical protein M3021_04490 [Actinomycetota bacterium]|nr:hypothetical protein [Actinomycetota bacterium]
MNRQIGGWLTDPQNIAPEGPVGGPVLPAPSVALAAALRAPAGSYAPASSYTVRGGAGSVSYVLSEMVLASSGLQRVADELADVERTAAGALNYAECATPIVGAQPFGLIPVLRDAAADCRECCVELQKTADNARTAVVRYQDAENQAMAGLEWQKSADANMGGLLLRVFGLPLAPFVAMYQATSLGVDVQKRGLRDVTEDVMGHVPDYLAGLLGFPPGLPSQTASGPGRTGVLKPAGVAAATGLRHFMDAAGLFMLGDLLMRRVPPSEWNAAQRPALRFPTRPGSTDQGPVPRPSERQGAEWGTGAQADFALGTMAPTLHDALAGSQDAYSVAPAAIVIKRVDRGDGSVAWIADLPGTEQWWPLDSANPWDVEGDVEAMTSAQRANFAQHQILVQEWVKSALRDAGAMPGEGVMINGHSGGGIHAAAMASDPAFLAEVNVRILNIAGAPAANQNVQPGIKVLALENVDDVVPALDLAVAPESADWVTVTTDRRRVNTWLDPGKLVTGAHSLDSYLDDADQLDGSLNVSVLAHREALLEFLGPAALTGAVSYRKFVYQGTDKNRQKMQGEKTKDAG